MNKTVITETILLIITRLTNSAVTHAKRQLPPQQRFVEWYQTENRRYNHGTNTLNKYYQ